MPTIKKRKGDKKMGFYASLEKVWTSKARELRLNNLKEKAIAKGYRPASKTTSKTTSNKVSLESIFSQVVRDNPGITQNCASIETYNRAGRQFCGNHFVNHFSKLIGLGIGYFGPVKLDITGGKARQGLYIK